MRCPVAATSVNIINLRGGGGGGGVGGGHSLLRAKLP